VTFQVSTTTINWKLELLLSAFGPLDILPFYLIGCCPNRHDWGPNGLQLSLFPKINWIRLYEPRKGLALPCILGWFWEVLFVNVVHARTMASASCSPHGGMRGHRYGRLSLMLFHVALILNHTQEVNGSCFRCGSVGLHTRICRFSWARITHRWMGGANAERTSQFQLWTCRVSGKLCTHSRPTHLILLFKAGDTLFKVIKNGFQVPGTVFEAMFSLPPGGELPVEGTSIETPIVLEGIDEQHFDAFLRVLYPLYVQLSP